MGEWRSTKGTMKGGDKIVSYETDSPQITFSKKGSGLNYTWHCIRLLTEFPLSPEMEKFKQEKKLQIECD